MNLPNKLTIARLILIPVFIVLFYLTVMPYNYLIACLIFIIAAATDFLDGYIARKYNLVTDLGKFLDPIADKVLVLSGFILIITKPFILNNYIGEIGAVLGGIGVSIIVAREMIVSVIRMMAATKGVVIAAEKIGKIKTFTTDICIVCFLISAQFPEIFVLYLISLAFYVLTVFLTVWSGIFYMVKNKKLFL